MQKKNARLLSHARAVTRSLRGVCLRVGRFVYVLKNKVRERDALHQKKGISLSLSCRRKRRAKGPKTRRDEPCLQSSEESLLTEKNFSAFPHEKVQKGPQLSHTKKKNKKARPSNRQFCNSHPSVTHQHNIINNINKRYL